MTISVAWVRTETMQEEMVFVSDSRLSGGVRWDCCPKIMTLPRSDCLISFAGVTDYSYPLMLQMSGSLRSYSASLNRRISLDVTKSHALRVFNQMREAMSDFPVGVTGPGDPEALFIFGGYSWQRKMFQLWTLHYDKDLDAFTFRPHRGWRGAGQRKKIAWVGDSTEEAKLRLQEKLDRKGTFRQGGFDMEPFEVVRDMIRDNTSNTIGGPPQVAKVYQHLNTQECAVYWPNRSGLLSIGGTFSSSVRVARGTASNRS